MAFYRSFKTRFCDTQKKVWTWITLFFAFVLIFAVYYSTSNENIGADYMISDNRNKESNIFDYREVDEQNKDESEKDYNYEDDDYSMNTSYIDITLSKVPSSFLNKKFCPACFGTNLCEEFEEGNLRINSKPTSTEPALKGVHFGKWHDKKVVIKLHGSSEGHFKLYDSFICKNASAGDGCDVSSAIMKSFVTDPKALKLDSLRSSYQIVHKKIEDLSFTMCATEKLIEEMKAFFDYDLSATIEPEEQAVFYTSLILNPEPVFLKFFHTRDHAWPMPRFYGACGRAVVVDDDGPLLSDFLNVTFQERADYAFQVLEIMDDLQNYDEEWLILFGDFVFENFAVTNEGIVSIVDMEDAAIIDKEAAAKYNQEKTLDKICNEECMEKLVDDLIHKTEDRLKSCSKLVPVGGASMYMLACKNLLSPFAEHKSEEDKEFTRHHKHGLLHSPPKEQEMKIKHLLEECIHETSVGGRLDAVENLKELLKSLT